MACFLSLTWVYVVAPRKPEPLRPHRRDAKEPDLRTIGHRRPGAYAKAEDRSWWKPFEVSVAEMTRDDPLARQIEHFGRVIRGEVEPIVRARDGLQNLRVIEAIAEAAYSGKIVDTTPA